MEHTLSVIMKEKKTSNAAYLIYKHGSSLLALDDRTIQAVDQLVLYTKFPATIIEDQHGHNLN